MTKLHQLAQLGQSIWYDNISRGVLESGEFQRLIDSGVLGVTSNPTSFEKAIAPSRDYDQAMARLIASDCSVTEIYEALALEDIGRAADMLRPIYDRTNGLDGYVSLEVSPRLAHDARNTIAEARRLFKTLGRPNVMIKVPATPAGIPAIVFGLVQAAVLFAIQVGRGAGKEGEQGPPGQDRHRQFQAGLRALPGDLQR